MSTPSLFFDSSALLAGVVSADGASRALLVLAEGGLVTVIDDPGVAERSALHIGTPGETLARVRAQLAKR